jgi:hypothetical protein
VSNTGGIEHNHMQSITTVAVSRAIVLGIGLIHYSLIRAVMRPIALVVQFYIDMLDKGTSISSHLKQIHVDVA